MQRQGEKTKKDEVEEALQRVLHGHSFRSSPQCQALLRYIVERSLSQDTEMLRERQIGINVFGRAPDYDTGNDPVVRARAAEVRKRLAQHYLHQDGVGEEIHIEIPSGSYRASFETRAEKEAGNAHHENGISGNGSEPSSERISKAQPAQEIPVSNAVSGPGPRGFWHSKFSWLRQTTGVTKLAALMLALAVVVIVIGVLGFAAGYGTGTYRSRTQREMPHAPASADTAVTAFWSPFLKEDPSPIIVYSDAMFLIDDSGNLFRYRHGAADDRGDTVVPSVAREYASSPSLVKAAGDLFYDNGYTGTGDLRAVVALVALFGRMGASPEVESSHELTTDDLKRHNVIIVGSSIESVALAELVPTGDFRFVNPDLLDPWSGALLDARPQPGEQPEYKTVLDPVTHRIVADYALISFQPGLVPGRHIAVLAGVDTTGCEGAALVLTSNAGAEEISNAFLQRKTGSEPHGPAPTSDLAFQALVRVDVARGYQVLDAHLVALHPFNAVRPATKNDSSH